MGTSPLARPLKSGYASNLAPLAGPLLDAIGETANANDQTK